MNGSADRSSLNRYHRTLLRYPLLDPAEEHALAICYRNTGSRAAEARLVTANLRLVVKIALEYCRGQASLLDLVQEGNLGLLHAVRKFDPHRGVKLAPYAAWWIRAYVLNFIRSDWHLVKITAGQARFKLFLDLHKTRKKLEKQGLPVDGERLAAALDVGERDIALVQQQMTARCASLDAPIRSASGEEERRTLADTLCGDPTWRPDVRLETVEVGRVIRERLRAHAATLPAQDLDILYARLSSEEPTPQGELARRLGVTRGRIQHVERRIKKRLRRRLTAELADAL